MRVYGTRYVGQTRASTQSSDEQPGRVCVCVNRVPLLNDDDDSLY